MPYIIGVAGSVAVAIDRACCRRCWWCVPLFRCPISTTDGFLFPNAVLERQGLMRRAFRSYGCPTLLGFFF